MPMANQMIIFQCRTDGIAAGSERRYDLLYDDGSGSGLQTISSNMSEISEATGFTILLGLMAHTGANVVPRPGNQLASVPAILIGESHINSNPDCAVCIQAFDLGSDAREMPCNRLYHTDCILRWLSIRNSCPLCRHELPSESPIGLESESGTTNIPEPMVLRMLRLPGGGVAFGCFHGETRFSGGGPGGGGDEERSSSGVYRDGRRTG